MKQEFELSASSILACSEYGRDKLNKIRYRKETSIDVIDIR
jgi:hypothetical protein